MPAWLVLATISLACCFFMVPVLVSASGPPGIVLVPVGLGALGSILAQGCLLAVWLAWGDLPFGRRLLHHWIVASLLCAVWLLGFLLMLLSLVFLRASDSEFKFIGPTVAMTVPLISIASQFPLWVVRHLFGWRLVRVPADYEAEPERPWAIRDLFLATLIVAVAFGIARLSPAALQEPEFRFAWLLGGAAACVITSITILPTAMMLLRIEPFQRGVRYSWLYALSYVVLLWILVAVIRWYGVGQLPPYYAFIGISLLIISFAGTVILAAKVARTLGYRLVTRSRRTIPSWTVQTAR
jgi:hypothetical protein